MKRKVLLLLPFLLLSSCGATTNNSSPTTSIVEESTISYTDASGYTNVFDLSKTYQNVAVLFSSYAQIWSATGGNISITVGDSVKRGFASENTTLVNDGAGLKIDSEILLAAKPDLVITTFDFAAQVKVASLCREQNIPTLQLKEESFADYLTILDLFSKLNHNQTSYSEYGLNVQKEIEEIKAKERGQASNYLFIRAGSAFSSTKIRKSEDHFACQIFNDLGAINVADTIGATLEDVSLEAILMAAPDKIIVAPQGDEEASKNYITSLFKEDGWNAVKAVKENQVFFVSKELFNYKPNQKWAESYAKAYDILYS